MTAKLVIVKADGTRMAARTITKLLKKKKKLSAGKSVLFTQRNAMHLIRDFRKDAMNFVTEKKMKSALKNFEGRFGDDFNRNVVQTQLEEILRYSGRDPLANPRELDAKLRESGSVAGLLKTRVIRISNGRTYTLYSDLYENNMALYQHLSPAELTWTRWWANPTKTMFLTKQHVAPKIGSLKKCKKEFKQMLLRGAKDNKISYKWGSTFDIDNFIRDELYRWGRRVARVRRNGVRPGPRRPAIIEFKCSW